MNAIAWNCRGLGNPGAEQFLIEYITRKKPDFVFLCETKVRDVVIQRIRRHVRFDGAFIVNSRGASGGLAMLWRNKDDGALRGYDSNHVDMNFTTRDGHIIRVTGIYGEPDRNLRYKTWDLLRLLAGSTNDSPWLVFGDLNNVMGGEDQRGGVPYPSNLITGFREAVEDSALRDLRIEGHRFTWERGRHRRDGMEIQLDRALVNREWMVLFPDTILLHGGLSTSDHAPIVVQGAKEANTRGYRQFRFEQSWVRDEECEGLIREVWNRNLHLSIYNRNVKIAEALAEWARERHRGIEKDIRQIQEQLNSLVGPRSEQRGAQIQALRAKLSELLARKNMMWKQRAKQFWLKGGDRNSRYFHAKASTRRRRRAIKKLRKASGAWVEWGSGLEVEITDFFNDLFSRGEEGIDMVSHLIPQGITAEDNERLLRPVSRNEVRTAVFSMEPLKSPGPDGFNPGYYQRFWSVLGDGVIGMVQEAFRVRRLPENFNDTNLVLIPKVARPERIGEFRPIALCNVLYKVITKIMVNRLKKVLHKVISESQSAFLTGRLITDNVVISGETLHHLKQRKQGNNGLMAMKLDMSKAYDRVEWNYLERVLLQMGFSPLWIEFMMECVRTAKLWVDVDGRRLGPLNMERGIRQGDPLSPYLFIICAEGLSRLIAQREEEGRIRGCRVARTAPAISHLFFADDSFLFSGANENEAVAWSGVLKEYEQASGQKVNVEKSSIVFSPNTPTVVRDQVKNILSMQEVEDTGTYLGLPSIIKRSRYESFTFIRDRIVQRLQGWDELLLSKAGKEVLLKAVIQALPTYTMGVYKIPPRLIQEIEVIMNRFWWSHNTRTGAGIKWKRWSRLCVHKHAGGMSFKFLEDFNLALLAKQGWRLVQRPNSLVARVLKAKYFPQCEFVDAKERQGGSYIWTSILAAQHLVKEGIRRRIGNGASTIILEQPWLPMEKGWVSPTVGIGPVMTVAQLMIPGQNRWNRNLVFTMFEPETAEAIVSMPLPRIPRADGWYWWGSKQGDLKVRDVYRKLQCREGRWASPEEASFWKKFWKVDIHPKVKHMAWRTLTGSLPTNVNLKRRHVPIAEECSRCGVLESENHVFFGCGGVTAIWASLNLPLPSTEANLTDWLWEMMERRQEGLVEIIMLLWWELWRSRNLWVWEHKNRSPEDAWFGANMMLGDWRLAHDDERDGNQAGDRILAWSRPENGEVKINVDGACLGANQAGGGMICRDAEGVFIAAKCVLYTDVTSPETVEILSIREALSWITERGWQAGILESDCQGAVQTINGEVALLSPLGVIVDECRGLLGDLNGFRLQFARRSANKVAHLLARNASDWVLLDWDHLNIPHVIADAIESDLN